MWDDDASRLAGAGALLVVIDADLGLNHLFGPTPLLQTPISVRPFAPKHDPVTWSDESHCTVVQATASLRIGANAPFKCKLSDQVDRFLRFYKSLCDTLGVRGDVRLLIMDGDVL